MDLDERKYRILQAIIDDYILTASPVGSRTISRKYEQKLSSATIRNEMSDLEELGYLDSPHTSAGRIPSFKAYRLYVDRLMGRVSLSEEEVSQVRRHFDRRMKQVHSVAMYAAQALSQATHYTSVIMTRPSSNAVLRVQNIQLVYIMPGTALMVLVTDTGIVKETVLHLGNELSIEDLHQISRILTERLAGVRLEDVPDLLRQMTGEWAEHRALLGDVLRGVQEYDVVPQQPEVVVGGSANLLSYPEYSDVEKARELLQVLETQDKLMQLLSHGGGMEFTIRIGPETGLPEMRDCSIVTGTYRVGSDTLGTIGVIGPTRMQYSRVIAVLDYVGRTFSQLLDGSE